MNLKENKGWESIANKFLLIIILLYITQRTHK